MRPCLDKNVLPLPYVKKGEGSVARRKLFAFARDAGGAIEVQLKKVA